MVGTIEDTMVGVLTGAIIGAITHTGVIDHSSGERRYLGGPMLFGPPMAMEDTHI